MQQMIEAFFYKQNKRGSHWLASLTLIKLYLLHIIWIHMHLFMHIICIKPTGIVRVQANKKQKMKANVAFCLQSVIKKRFCTFTLT